MRNIEPQLSVRAVAPVVAGLESLGHDAAAVLAAAPIDPAVLGRADHRIPHGTMMRFWDRACDLTGDDHLGMHVAEAAPTSSFGLHAYTVLSSPNLREAYRRACRYQRLIHEATHLVFDEGPDAGVLRHALPGGFAVPRQPAEFLVTAWVRFGREVTGEEWLPEEVRFAHPGPSDRSEHERLFGPAVRFSSGATALGVSSKLLDLENTRGDTGLLDVLDEHARTLLARVPERPSISDRARIWLAEALHGGTPSADDLAAALNLSARSLNRGLKAEGTTYRGILDQLRHERAAALLGDSRYSITEIAYLLGFAEISSFYRAFKRWAGTTPADYRAVALDPGTEEPG